MKNTIAQTNAVDAHAAAIQLYTPGPWGVESDGSTVTMAGQCVIVGPAPDGAGRDEEKANARLIAAAPETAAERDSLREINAELLAALTALYNAAPCAKPANNELWEALKLTRAAIAKAKGGAA
jgi:hypothetical protein